MGNFGYCTMCGNGSDRGRALLVYKMINYFLADAKAPAKPKRSKIEPINLTEEAEMTPIRGATE